MDYKIRIIRYLYYFSLLGLLILYLFPGSLIGYFFYGDLGRQPDLIPNPLGTSINHALAFFYLTIIGLVAHINEGSLKRTIFFPRFSFHRIFKNRILWLKNKYHNL